MKKNKIALLALASVIVAPLAAGLTAKKANSASLTDINVFLSTNAASGSNTNVDIVFSTTTNLTADSIITVSFDSGFAEAPGQLVTADVDVYCDSDNDPSTNGTAMTNVTVTDSAADTLVLDLNADTCNNFLNINITGGTNNLDNPGSAGNYPVSITADVGGAGSTYDVGAGLAFIEDANEVIILAQVVPVIDLELYVVNSNTLLSDPNSCNLGVLSPNSVNSCQYDIGFSTNTTTGVTVKVYADDTLNNSGDTADINDVTDGTVDAASEEYGFRLTNMGTGCSATASGSYGSQYNPVPVGTQLTATTIFTTTGTCDNSGFAQRVEVTHQAAMSPATQVDLYDQQVSYVEYSN